MSAKEKKKGKRSKGGFGFYIGLAILLFVDALFLAGTFYLLIKLPQKAGEIKEIRNLQLRESKDIEIAKTEVESSKTKYETLNSYLPDEEGVLNFIGKVDELKRQGIISNFSFSSSDVLKDKTGNLGLPFIVEVGGGWEQIKKAIEALEKIPYLIRAVQIDAQKASEEDFINFKYGGFLYVAEDY